MRDAPVVATSLFIRWRWDGPMSALATAQDGRVVMLICPEPSTAPRDDRDANGHGVCRSTEFVLGVTEAGADLWVFEGRGRVSNPRANCRSRAGRGRWPPSGSGPRQGSLAGSGRRSCTKGSNGEWIRMTPYIVAFNQFFDGGYYGPQLLLLFLLPRRSSPRDRELAAVSGGDRHRRAGHCG